jgi:hypothetical protein
LSLNSPTADRITAGVLLALGAGFVWGGFTMDRLEMRQIHPASIPGLVPMILGAALMVCAVLLFLGARGASRGPAETGGSWRDLGTAAAWSVFYAVALVGKLPFLLATGIYVAGFVWWFRRDADGKGGPVGRAATALAFGAAVSVAVSALFRYGFLVRLP